LLRRSCPNHFRLQTSLTERGGRYHHAAFTGVGILKLNQLLLKKTQNSVIYRKTYMYSTSTIISFVNIFHYFCMIVRDSAEGLPVSNIDFFLAVLALSCHRKYSPPTCHFYARECTAEVYYCSVFLSPVNASFVKQHCAANTIPSKPLVEKLKSTLTVHKEIKKILKVSECIRICVSTVRTFNYSQY